MSRDYGYGPAATAARHSRMRRMAQEILVVAEDNYRVGRALGDEERVALARSMAAVMGAEHLVEAWEADPMPLSEVVMRRLWDERSGDA